LSGLLDLGRVEVNLSLQLLFLLFKLVIRLAQGLVPREDVVEFLELIRVLLLDLLEECFELLQLLDLGLDLDGLPEEVARFLGAFTKLILLLFDFLFFDFVQFCVLFATHFMRLQEGGELDKVILNEYILLA